MVMALYLQHTNICSGEKMITSYLEKLQKEYLEEKLDIEKELNNLQIYLKENQEFIKLLEETNDPNYESFSPRDINTKNKERIQKLKEEQKSLLETIKKQRNSLLKAEQKLEELSNIVKLAKTTLSAQSIDSPNDEFYKLALLETQEKERQRISRELHDSTVQNLTSLVHKTELCSKLVEIDKVRCKLELNTMSKTLREIINDTRQMIYDLRPMSFDDIGLDTTIERALEKLESSQSKKISFTVVGKPYKIKSVIGITLLRIIQEACSNAIRHANPSLVQVILKYGDGKIEIQIEDNGKGFDVQNVESSFREDNSGFGLSMMKERVYLLSGNIKIDSTVEDGTKINVEVPVKKKEENK